MNDIVLVLIGLPLALWFSIVMGIDNIAEQWSLDCVLSSH
jgi:hypothetical protein